MSDFKTIQFVSVVIPVYNEQDSLSELLKRTIAACDSMGKQYEIVLVDDGSSDRSAEILREAAQRPGSRVVAVLLNRNYGQHSAIMAGFNHIKGDLVITLDADLQNPPEEIHVWWRLPIRVMTWWVPSGRTVRIAGSVGAPRA